jgi:Lipocalin-like domain
VVRSAVPHAAENSLLGSWKLRSYVVTTAEGHRTAPYGERPIGCLTYSADGRMQIIATAADRAAPASDAPSDMEQLGLYRTMFAYAGTYSLEANRVTHHVDISWNEAWTGTDQVRLFTLVGNSLTLSTHSVDQTNGKELTYDVSWERIDESNA